MHAYMLIMANQNLSGHCASLREAQRCRPPGAAPRPPPSIVCCYDSTRERPFVYVYVSSETR